MFYNFITLEIDENGRYVRAIIESSNGQPIIETSPQMIAYHLEHFASQHRVSVNELLQLKYLIEIKRIGTVREVQTSYINNYANNNAYHYVQSRAKTSPNYKDRGKKNMIAITSIFVATIIAVTGVSSLIKRNNAYNNKNIKFINLDYSKTPQGISDLLYNYNDFERIMLALKNNESNIKSEDIDKFMDFLKDIFKCNLDNAILEHDRSYKHSGYLFNISNYFEENSSERKIIGNFEYRYDKLVKVICGKTLDSERDTLKEYYNHICDFVIAKKAINYIDSKGNMGNIYNIDPLARIVVLTNAREIVAYIIQKQESGKIPELVYKNKNEGNYTYNPSMVLKELDKMLEYWQGDLQFRIGKNQSGK